MELVVKGDLLRQMLEQARMDDAFAINLAEQLVNEIDPTALNAYLLTAEVATRLLAERIVEDPEDTIQALRELPERTSPPPQGKKRRRRRKRRRYTDAEIEEIKNAIIVYVQDHPWTNRRNIQASVFIPSLALYHRVIGELKEEEALEVRGTRSKTCYRLTAKGKRRARRVPKKA